ncbi:MAG: TIR domain-containing protein, partial [Ktedonobacterales bacterium]
MATIFLSYRRTDSKQVAIRLYQWLVSHGVPAHEIFFDDQSIPRGARFPDTIKHAVCDAAVVLAIIGPRWLTEKSPGLFKKPRIFERDDWVRQEIALALQSQRPIIPVLLDGMHMPTLAQLPPSITALNECEAQALRSDTTGLDEDMLHLAAAVQPYAPDLYFDGITFVDLGGARRTYLDALERRYHDVSLPVDTGEPLPLNAIYQPLALRRDPLLAADLEREERRALEDEPEYDADDPRRLREREADVPRQQRLVRYRQARRRRDERVARAQAIITAATGDDALRQSRGRHIVVLGGPGTGKTTMLFRFTCDAARAASEYPDQPLPVFISLPELARSGQWTSEQLPEFLHGVLQPLGVPASYALTLAQAIASGKAFVCLDGLDEVSPGTRPQIVAWINGLPAPTGAGAIIVGSRFTEYKGQEFKAGQYTQWELKPLNHALREQLAASLLPLLRPAAVTDPTDPTAFVRALEQHPQAASWGENPLLFTLAAYVYAQHGALPERRVALYRIVTDAIIRARDPEKTVFSLQTARDVLAGLALELFKQRGRTFDERDVVSLLRPICADFNIYNEAMDRMYARVLGSGLLAPVASQTYGFRHLTFQEYLCATALAFRLTEPSGSRRGAIWELIREKRTHSRWTEVLRLMVGILA